MPKKFLQEIKRIEPKKHRELPLTNKSRSFIVKSETCELRIISDDIADLFDVTEYLAPYFKYLPTNFSTQQAMEWAENYIGKNKHKVPTISSNKFDVLIFDGNDLLVLN